MAINRKKLPAVLLAIILIFVFTACVSSNNGYRNLAIRNRKIHRLPPEKRSLSIFQDPEIQSESPVLFQTN